MLSELEYCLGKRNLVGVYCPLLGNGLFLVGVENIVYGDDGTLIVFYSQDMSGHVLSRRTLHIDEINMIVPFNNPYISPLPVTMRTISIAGWAMSSYKLKPQAASLSFRKLIEQGAQS